MKKPELTVTNGNLEAIVLSMTAREELHGYRVIRKIRKERKVYLGPSTIYPLLKEMASKGLLTSRWDFSRPRPRKLYRITEKGRAELRAIAMELQAISSEVAKVLYTQ